MSGKAWSNGLSKGWPRTEKVEGVCWSPMSRSKMMYAFMIIMMRMIRMMMMIMMMVVVVVVIVMM